MKPLVSLLALAAACLASLVIYELRPQPAAPSAPVLAPARASATPAPTVPAARETRVVSLDALLARPLFSQTRRPATAASATATPVAAVTKLPRMMAILIDGPRRSAIFASSGDEPGGKLTVVAEGGHIGSFTVQTIEPQQVVVVGPEGRRIVRTSFDPTLPPAAPPPQFGLGTPQFPGIAPPIAPPPAPSAGYGLPPSAGAAR